MASPLASVTHIHRHVSAPSEHCHLGRAEGVLKAKVKGCFAYLQLSVTDGSHSGSLGSDILCTRRIASASKPKIVFSM